MDCAAAAHGKLDTCVELSGDDNEMKAKVSIVRTDPFRNVPKGNADAVSKIGGPTGTWPAERPAWTAAHEAGHLMGLEDEYVSGMGPRPGYENNIMGARDKKPSENDIEKIINNPKNNTGSGDGKTGSKECNG